MPPPLLVPVPLLAGALRPGPGQARSWLERELSRPDYRESLLQRVTGWLLERWQDLQGAALSATPLSTAAAVLVLLVLLVLMVLVVRRVRRDPRLDRSGDPALADGTAGAQDHRVAAEAALAEGAHDLAVVEGFRAVAARAVQRGVLEERPGLTAHELATDLAPLFPLQADALARTSALFDEVFYGGRAATAEDPRAVLDLDDALRSARPDPVPR